MLTLAVVAPNAFQELRGRELNSAPKPARSGQLQRLFPDIQIGLVQLRPGVNDLDPLNAGFLHALLERPGPPPDHPKQCRSEDAVGDAPAYFCPQGQLHSQGLGCEIF